MADVICIVRYSDCDNDYSIGYFTDIAKAELCCEYENKTNPSPYCDNPCEIERYELYDIDYAKLLDDDYDYDYFCEERQLLTEETVKVFEEFGQ